MLRHAPGELLDSSSAPWWRSLVRRLFSFGNEFRDLERVERIPILPVLALAAIGLLLRSGAPLPKFRPEFNRTAFPVAAMGVFDRHPAHRILTGDQWGDYLVYRRYPEKVFVDDRSDFYGDAFAHEWVTLLNGRPDWREVFRQLRFDAVLLNVSDPLASVLKESGEWTPVYDDGRAIIFLPGRKNF
jgi:hypothetical protein